MSVFAGGCDLDALAAVAVTAAAIGRADPLEPVTALQDFSLITVTEGIDGEPRLGMLETIREYALERLGKTTTLDGARHRHAEHYAASPNGPDEQIGGPAQLDRPGPAGGRP